MHPWTDFQRSDTRSEKRHKLNFSNVHPSTLLLLFRSSLHFTNLRDFCVRNSSVSLSPKCIRKINRERTLSTEGMKRIPRFEFRGTKMNKESSCMLKYFPNCSLYSYTLKRMKWDHEWKFSTFSNKLLWNIENTFQACMNFSDNSMNITNTNNPKNIMK